MNPAAATAGAARRDRLRSLLEPAGIDALLVTTLVNVRYLTGFTGSAGELLVSTDASRDRFVTDGRYDEQSAREVPDLARLIVAPPDWLTEALPDGMRLGLEAHTVAWQRARTLEQRLPERVVAAPRLVEELRVLKDEQEVTTLRQACALADQAFADLGTWLRAGLSEREAAMRLDRAMVDLGADAPSFATILAGGPNTAVPHHQPTDRVLQAGDLVKVDFGATVDGYHSDMTRMLSLGPPPARLAEVFDVVRVAQQAGLRRAVDGAGTGDVDAACRAVIDAAGLGAHFTHGTGHGIGLEIHEDPFLRPAQPRPEAAASESVTLRTGMTVTVEPGVYIPGVGGARIEDSLVVAPPGPDVLTQTPKDLVVL